MQDSCDLVQHEHDGRASTFRGQHVGILGLLTQSGAGIHIQLQIKGEQRERRTSSQEYTIREGDVTIALYSPSATCIATRASPSFGRCLLRARFGADTLLGYSKGWR